ncbi:MAG TPA: sigma factor-like helix-turn-helix DNA-binding protein, partial [Gemmatimonadales bacterium]|nr:sigma factor-like helix-turn-helix DNA-binding protein [Gemmatimonadales bacterium]
ADPDYTAEVNATVPKRRREVEDPDGGTAARLAVPPEQDGHVDLEDLKAALAQLPIDQREALLLVGPQGFSYEEAAAICGARIGTIKSRVNRARTRLAELLGIESPEDIGADRVVKATIFNETYTR